MTDRKILFENIIEFYLTQNNLTETEANEIVSLRNDLKAINYMRCCEALKTKEAPTFEHWLLYNFEETKSGKYIDFNNGDTYRDKKVLKLKYNKIFKPTL